MAAQINRRALAAGLLAATATPAIAKARHSVPTLRGDDTARLSEATFRSHTCITAGFFPGAHVRGVREPFSDIDPSSGTERRSDESVQKSDAKP